MPDPELLRRLARFEKQVFPRYKTTFRRLVDEGQQPKTLFIGCSDSRIVPFALMDCGPGDLFIARNVGNLIPPWDMSAGFHGTAAAIEFAVLQLQVQNIIVCGHSHCGAIRGLYEPPPAEATHLAAWLELARDAVLPVRASPEALRRVEQRSIVLQLERLLSYPMVASRVQQGELFLHGWYYVIESGQVLVLEADKGRFVPLDELAAAPAVPSSPATPAEVDASHWSSLAGPA
ncbi:MAG: carbonic anhydrase [Burkholderiales bacterium]|nr:MAG: carbonic anhydrase [Burkholderiales bacterium]